MKLYGKLSLMPFHWHSSGEVGCLLALELLSNWTSFFTKHTTQGMRIPSHDRFPVQTNVREEKSLCQVAHSQQTLAWDQHLTLTSVSRAFCSWREAATETARDLKGASLGVWNYLLFAWEGETQVKMRLWQTYHPRGNGWRNDDPVGSPGFRQIYFWIWRFALMEPPLAI